MVSVDDTCSNLEVMNSKRYKCRLSQEILSSYTCFKIGSNENEAYCEVCACSVSVAHSG